MNYNLNCNDSNDIVFTMKGAKLHALLVTLSERDNQNLSKVLNKGRIKIQQINIDIFLNQILLDLMDYLY